MQRYIRFTTLLLPMGILFVLYQQCSGVKFQGASNEVRWQHECSEDASKCHEKTESFDTSMGNKQIDFVWVVDNSGSMKEEIAKTQANISSFANSLKDYSDLRMALLSAKDSSVLPPNSPGPQYFTLPSVAGLVSTQINRFVASNDSLIMAALSICPDSAAANSWCSTFTAAKNAGGHKDVDGNVIDDAYWNAAYGPTYKSLNSFVREQSHKVFVIVSDDDARDDDNPYRVKGDQFLDAYQSRFPNSLPIVYSIVSQRTKEDAKKANCDVYAKGTEYINLSTATNGKSYDICENDWSGYFTSLLESMKTLAQYSFTLSTVNIVDITAVRINGVEIAQSDYVYANRTISISPSLLNGGSGIYNIDVDLIEYVP